MEYYKYRPLAENAIRVIRFNSDARPHGICLDLLHHDLGSFSEPHDSRYFALSYCWGDASDACDIAVGECKLQVTRSLRSALVRMRTIVREAEHGETFLWIDQICINQENVQERNEQVHNMWRIYFTAAHVYAWLGNGTWTSEHVTQDLQEASSVEITDSDGSTAVREERYIVADALPTDAFTKFGSQRNSYTFRAEDKLSDNVMMLLDLPYFTRTWIVPEILNAQGLTFLYGLHTCPARELKDALDLLTGSSSNLDWRNMIKIHEVRNLLTLRDERETLFPAQVPRIGDLSLDALQLLHHTSCADVRDRVFAALSNPNLVAKPRMAEL